MFKADILTLPLCGVEGISHTCTHTMNIGRWETTQSIEKLRLVVQCTPTHCLLLIPGYIVNHHHFFLLAFTDLFDRISVTWLLFALLTAACLPKDAPTTAVTFLLWLWFIAIMHAFVLRLLHWPEHRKTVQCLQCYELAKQAQWTLELTRYCNVNVS